MSEMISFDLFTKLEKNEYKPIVDLINKDDTLELRFRGKSASIYYRGLELAAINENSIELNKSYCRGLFDVEMQNSLLEIIPYLKQNADIKFAENKKTYENEFSQLISRENNSAKLGNTSDYFILEEEYKLNFEDGEKSDGRADLIGVHINHSPNNRKAQTITTSQYGLILIETKYLDGSFGGDAGIAKHISDFARLFDKQNQTTMNEIAQDLEKIFNAKRNLGFIPGLNGKIDTINISRDPDDMEFVLALIGHNTNTGRAKQGENLINILQNQLDQYPDRITDRILVAQTSEIGFGLYDDRMIKLKEYIAKSEV